MIEFIVEEWRKDCKLDDTELDSEALRIPNLHAKYLKLLADHKVKLRSLKIKQKQLHKTLYDYYKGDLNNQEDLERIKRDPQPKTILKQDIPMYLEGDEDLIKAKHKVDYHNAMCDFAENVMKTLNNRGFQIKNAIDWKRFLEGSI